MRRDHWDVMRLVWRHQRRQWPLAVAAAGLLFGTAALQLPAPFLTRYLFDRVIPSGQPARLHALGLALVAVVLAYHAFSYLFHRLLVVNRIRVERSIRQELWTRVLGAPLRTVTSRPKGYLEARLDADVDRLGDLFLENLLQVLLDIVTLLVGIGILFYLNAFLAVISLLGVPLLAVISQRYLGRVERASARRQEAWARFRGSLVELLALLGVVKAHCGEPHAHERYRRSLDAALEEDRRYGFLSVSASTAAAVGAAIVPLFVLWYGSWSIMRGTFTVGSFLAFHGALGYLFGPVRSLVGISFDVAAAMAAGRRLLAVLSWPQEPRGGGRVPPARFVLQVRDLRVAPSPERVVGPVSFTLPPGQWMALVGETGVGKSSVLRALVGMEEIVGGEVMLGERPLREYDLAEVRRRVLLVPQEVLFFAGSIRENLSIFAPGAGASDVGAALQWAVLDEAIARQPRGLETDLAEGGASLSGGERQRLALARALLLRPSVLLLDEVTAGLDAATEAELLRRLRALPWRPAVVWVTHRHAPLAFVDRVVELRSPGVAPAGGSARGGDARA